jgi:hypothetical protein
MKNKKISSIIIVAVLIVIAGFYYTSTGFTGSVSNTASKVSLTDSTKADVYVCPMHSDITSDKAGTCSKCGMDLVKKEDKDSDKQMNMNDCMQKCKDMGCNMENCKGSSGACKDCGKDGKCMMNDKDCKMKSEMNGKMDGKDCKSKCMGK